MRLIGIKIQRAAFCGPFMQEEKLMPLFKTKDKTINPRELERSVGETAAYEASKASQRSSFKTNEKDDEREGGHLHRRKIFRKREEKEVLNDEKTEEKKEDKEVKNSEQADVKKDIKKEEELHKKHALDDNEHALSEKKKVEIKNMIKDMREAIRGKGREVAEDSQYLEPAAEKGAATVQNAYSNVQEASNLEKSDFKNGKEDDYFKKGTEVGILDREDENIEEKERIKKEMEEKEKRERERAEKEAEKIKKKMKEFVKEAAVFSAFDATAKAIMKENDDPKLLGKAYGNLLKEADDYKDAPGAFKKLQYVYDKLELGRPEYEREIEKEIKGQGKAFLLKEKVEEDRDIERGDED